VTFVLVVDDNHDSADALAMLVRLWKLDARVAYDGPSALEAVRDAVPDVVLLDIGLPGLDGYEVARRLRADPRLAGTRLVALTGYGTREDKERAAAAGFDAHLTKPVDPAALRALLGDRGQPE
jgi:CheY-like chemotaxis protein